MEVSHVADHVTHAVIGGEASIEFGISSSAEFFNILSSTLYKDQKLAVVRETLCNAWDAHIEAGCTDRPIIVTVNAEKFSVEDFGRGIAKDKIGPIYGVYGASTKKHDGNQTGGFGLGCKAPFAYTDHFEVISGHGGEKTIYNMSKSAAQVQGKPSIIPIATFPSTDTGIKVTLEMKSKWDYSEFEALVHRIARNGEMNVLVNGKQIETIPFSTMKHGFLVTTDDVYPASNQRIFIRYGNVIYPVTDHNAYDPQYRQIKGFLERLGYYNQQSHKIIFQAPPHSISVTPSREELSMQEHTINTLTKLFTSFVQYKSTTLERESYQVLAKSIEKAVAENKAGHIYHPTKRIPFINSMAASHSKYKVEISGLATLFCSQHYPVYTNFRQADIRQRINTLIDKSIGPKGLLQSFRAAYDAEQAQKGVKKEDPESWFLRKVVAPLVLKMGTDPMLSADRLMVYGHGQTLDSYPQRYEVESCIRATQAARLPMEHYLPYLRNIIVLSFTKLELEKRVGRFPHVTEEGGASRGYLLYVLPRVQKRVEAAREFFKAQGMQIIDLTVAHEWEDESIVEPEKKEAAPKKPKKEGYICASNGLVAMPGTDTVGDCLKNPDGKRITGPKWVSRMPTKNREGIYNYEVGGCVAGSSIRSILHLFGDEGAFVTTDVQMRKAGEAGAKHIDDYVIPKVCEYILKSKAIAEWYAFSSKLVFHDDYYRESTGQAVYKLIMSQEELRKHYALIDNRTLEDKRYLKIWLRIKNECSNGTWDKRFPEIQKVRKHLAAITVHANAKKCRAVLDKNKFLKLLDINRIQAIFELDPATNKAEIDTTMQILLLALQG